MAAPIKTCVLGVGLSGLTFHVPFVLALPELFALHGVLERNPQGPGGKLQARFGPEAAKGVKIFRSIDEVVADPEVELVIVGTPNETHFDYAKRAVEAGKHVLVDKPVCTSFAEAQELGALAKQKGVVLYPYQNRRWDSDFFALQALLRLPPSDPNSIGTLWEFESRFDRYRTELKGTWKDLPLRANGLTYDLAAHTVDQALVLFGRPQRVTARIENLRGIGNKEVDDNFTITLHYPPRPSTSEDPVHPTSFTAVLRGTSLSAKSTQFRYVARGTTGTFTKGGVDVQEDQLRALQKPSDIRTSATFGKEPEEIFAVLENQRGKDVVRSVWPSKEKGNYAGLFEDLAKSIRQGTPQAVKWEESAEVLEIIELAFKSSKEGRTVDVPPRA